MSASFSSCGGSVCAVVDLGGSGVAGGFTRLMNWIIWLQSSRVPPSQSTARAWHSGLYFWGLIYVCLEKRCRNRTRDGSSRLYSCHGNRAVQEGFIVDQVIGTVAVRTRAVSSIEISPTMQTGTNERLVINHVRARHLPSFCDPPEATITR